jgi:hypothetical protein
MRPSLVLLPAALALATPFALAEEAAPPEPPSLMGLLEKSRMAGPIERSRVEVSGWVEASLTTTPTPDEEVRRARVFDDEAEGFRLQQAYLAVARPLWEKPCFDVGGKVALLWGTDARFLHARGLFDDQEGDEQFDLLEAHALVRFPVGRGLDLKVGKWTTPMGFEVIEAPNNLLPSRSFLFGFAIPFTHTGAIASLQVSDRVKVGYGLVFGWDVWDDNNDALTHLGTFAWTSPSSRDAVTVNAIVGAEREDEDDDLRVVVDATWTHEWSDRWKTALNVDVGTEEGAAPGGGDATWWGAAAYVTRTFSDSLAATFRAEVFEDEDGTRLGEEASLGELTLGVDWTPWCRARNVHLRPEVRWDHSFDGGFFGDDGDEEDQVSLTLDVVVTF